MSLDATNSGDVLVPSAARHDRTTFRELTAWSLLAIGAAYWANVIRYASRDEAVSLAAVANDIVSAGAFDVLAWFVIFESTRTAPRNERASRVQIFLAVLISAICIIPSDHAVAAGMVAFAVFLYSHGKAEVHTRCIAIMLLALALEIVSRSEDLVFFHVAIGRLDAQVVAALYRAFGYACSVQGNVVEIVGSQFSVIILAGCASSYMLASICLAFLAITLFRDQTPRWSSVGWLCAACLANVVLNELRLVAEVSSNANYEWWHNGSGATLYSLAATALVATLSLMATREPRRAQTETA